MIIKKFKNGNLHLKLDKEEINKIEISYEIAELDDFFWNDLRLSSFGNEWSYIIDDHTGLVYMIDSYGWNLFHNMIQGKNVIFKPCGTIKDEEYQNEGDNE